MGRRREEQPAPAADEEAVRREGEVEERHGCVCVWRDRNERRRLQCRRGNT